MFMHLIAFSLPSSGPCLLVLWCCLLQYFTDPVGKIIDFKAIDADPLLVTRSLFLFILYNVILLAATSNAL